MHRSRLGGHMAGGSSKQARKRAKKSSSSANSRGKSTTGSNGRRRARKKAATGPTQAVRTQTRRALADIFPGVAPSTLARGVTTRELRAGDILCEEGDPADAAWVIVTGRLRASVREGEQTRILGDNGPGELIGEAALLDGGVRAATLRAVRDTRVAVLDQAWLAQLMTSSPDAIQRVLASVLERRQRANVIQDRVVTLLPATPSAVATAEAIAGRLADTMDAVVVRSGDRTGRGGTWLTRLEDAHDLVVLVADPEWSGWTEQVTRSADRLAIVVDVEDGPAPSEVEIAAEGNGRDANDRRVLVLAHPPATERPRGTRAWLAERTVDLHLHMRRDDAGDLGRVARHLANQAVGLVLGGGGARGLAELGVWKTLDEHGVPVDLVTGSSMGAVMGTLVAIGMTPDDALDHARRAFEGIKDPTLPVASLVRGRRLWDQIRDTVGDMDLEDAWITFACMSTDLTAMTPYVHRTGAFADALRASLAIPGVFTPVDINGHLHVDGGLLDNLPVDAASEIDPTARLIVVDVAPPGGPRAVEHIPRDLSGWRLLRQRLLPWAQAPRVPPLVATMLQSTFVGAGRQRLAALGIELESEEALNAVFARFKELADKKHEIFDEDLVMLVSDDALGHENEHFKLVSIQAQLETGETPSARVVISEDGAEKKAEAHGSGQVDAAFKAIESIVSSGADLQLFSVNAITSGTDSQGEVSVRLSKSGRVVNGHGADTDIVIASAKAYLNAINKLHSGPERLNPQL
ncbi:MAG: alpha-isopropylmalate synthase regulatory domain-containing protein [Nitriliruptorales bacterium]|nr:alpha-isopropylmalate synthase regulatory domain-containing protein [Nitriliruptorales bacterium]